jgi:hypothetical protein
MNTTNHNPIAAPITSSVPMPIRLSRDQLIVST